MAVLEKDPQALVLALFDEGFGSFLLTGT